MPRKKPLTDHQWAEVGRKCRLASAAIHRIGGPLLRTEPAAVYDRWARFRDDIDRRTRILFDTCEDEGLKRRDGDQTTPGPGELRWGYGWKRATSSRKTPLTRAEWIVVGDDVKRCEALLTEVAFTLQDAFTQAFCKPWFALTGRIDVLKSALDNTACGQHPGWKEATRVFYGKPSDDHPELRASVPESEIVAAERGDEYATVPDSLVR